MGNGILEDIVKLEKEIQQSIAAEQQRAAAWLAQVQEEADRQHREEQQVLEQSIESAKVEAKSISEKKAARIRQKGNALAEGFDAISDETLEKIILRHIGAILPGEKHDHQDVQD